METIHLVVSGMTCGACVKHVEKAIKSIAGVSEVEVDLTSGSVKVEGDVSKNVNAIIAALVKDGYPAKVIEEESLNKKMKSKSCKSSSGCCCN
jgi:copper chaperone CopZ